MNHVYLIVADKKKPGQLSRLINRLGCLNTTFVVHLDALTDKNIFISDKSEFAGNVFFLEKRFSIHTGSFHLIEAILIGLHWIMENLPGTERVTLLRDSDYPIKTAREINNYLQARPDTIFIEYFNINRRHWRNFGLSRFPRFDKISEKMKVYVGPLCWSLPIYAIKAIISLLDEYPHYTSYFRQVKFPDESFFQTLLLNSEEESILNNIENGNLKLTWWNMPYATARACKIEDMDLFLKSKNLFAGKFDSTLDSYTLDDIDFRISNIQEFRKCRKNKIKAKSVERQAVTMLTNDLTYLSRYYKLQQELPEEFSPYLLLHCNSSLLHENIAVDGLFRFDNSILSTLNVRPIASSLVPGSNHFPLLSFYKANPDFEYYWLIEDDVCYNENWSHFFRNFSIHKNMTDFITCYVRPEEMDPYWYWWGSLKAPDSQTDMHLHRIASFNPIYRLSNKALKFLYEQLLNGWSGHHEVLIPTLLYNAKFSIMDFGENAEFCFPRARKMYYTKNREIDGQVHGGSFRFRPVVEPQEMTKKILYHPVKFHHSTLTSESAVIKRNTKI